MNEALRLCALRGATGCTNTEQDIQEKVTELYEALLSRNGLEEEQIVSVQFTVTPDITVLNPATALRRAGKAQNVALFAAAEPVIDGMLPRMIRILIHCYLSKDHKPEHVYIHGAEQLRPDLMKGPSKIK
ncbi:chorismate mutase [Gracilinema caldarium]|uniref:chorismate mutase n=1 Tax=Gracilinema caldarium (strain ATCC 51460 / DSM 7334 / H1) TaxID=744872 RepID=F8F3G9_GRAC1|nr:chorismate mutase [Gracilinema caldarium]AEJ19545.1 chorismate mutase [Gracilinema caldarium DSM 7334]